MISRSENPGPGSSGFDKWLAQALRTSWDAVIAEPLPAMLATIIAEAQHKGAGPERPIPPGHPPAPDRTA